MHWLIVAGCGHTGTTVTSKIIGINKSVHLIESETRMFMPLGAAKLRSNIEKKEDEARAAGHEFVCEKTPQHIHHIDNIRKE